MLQDIRYALRQFISAPAFNLITILTLSLGVGLATAVFSVINAVILQPLPFPQPSRLVFPETFSRVANFNQPCSYPGFKDMRERTATMDLAAWSRTTINLQSPSGPVALRAVKTSDNFFRVLGVPPVHGRTFLDGEDQPGKDNVVVLSYEVWQTNFAGSYDVIGRSVSLDGAPYVVIGIMPAGFRYPLSTRNAVYTPLHVDAVNLTARGNHWMQTVARLKDGVTPQHAQDEMNGILANMGKAFPETDGGRHVVVIPLQKLTTEVSKSPLQTLAIAALLLLGIGCLNVAGLLLARGVKREKEIALRAAIGASRARLLRQLLTESLLLAAVGMAGGVALAFTLLQTMRAFLIRAMSRGSDIHIDVPVLLVALALSAGTSILASFVPALRLSATDPNTSLKSGGNTGTDRAHHRLRAAFITTQVALAMVLLVVSGLLVRNIIRTRNTDLGFEPRNLLTTEIGLPSDNYKNRDMYAAFYQPLLERVQHLPGVKAAGIIQIVPIDNWGWNSDVNIVGQPPSPPDQAHVAEHRYVSPGYFEAFNIGLVRGRLLDPSIDTDPSALAIVVNEAFVKRFIPNGEDPIGKQLKNDEHITITIVGVVKSVRQDIYRAPMPEMDYLASQTPPQYRNLTLTSMQLVVRTEGDPMDVIPSVREAYKQVDPTVPFRDPLTMDDVIAETLVFKRLQSWLFGIFASFALLLAVVGLYGLITQEVELSTREIGVRVALGASRTTIAGMIYRRVALMLFSGVAVGVLLTLAARQIIASVVELHASRDTSTIAVLGVVMIAAGLLAAALPARRAATIEPIKALRYD